MDVDSAAQGPTLNLRTTRHAADALGISIPRVKQLATELGVGAKIGREWLFTDQDIEAMRRRPDRRRKGMGSES